MMQFYVNYTDNAQREPGRFQEGPYQTVPLATERRAELEGKHGLSHCWVGISRDERFPLLPTMAQRGLKVAG